MNEQPFQVPKPVGALLAFGAGVIDVCTYMGLFGVFVAQVTGSFAIVGAQAVRYDPHWPLHTIALPIFFVAGVGTAFLAALAGRLRPALCCTLGVELVLIGGFVGAGLTGWPFAEPNAPLALTTGVLGIAAMGVQSASVRLLFKGHPSTNVMTSNTSELALNVAHWAGAAWRATRHPDDADAVAARQRARACVAPLWPVFAGFFVGAVCGAVVFTLVGFWCALISLATIGGVLIWAVRFAPRT